MRVDGAGLDPVPSSAATGTCAASACATTASRAAPAAACSDAEAAQGEIVTQMQDLVGPNGAQAVQALLAGARNPASGLVATLVASAVLLLAATSVFVELKGSLDEL